MLLFSIELAPGEREKYLRRRGGLRFAFSWSDHSRIGLASFSDRLRIGNDTSTVFGKFLSDVGMQFCVAGTIFGEVGG